MRRVGKWNIYRVLADYFMSLFSSTRHVDINSVTSLVAGRITTQHLEILSRPIIKEDVEEALFQMHPNKAPGVDGLPALFYHKFWHIVGEDRSVLSSCFTWFYLTRYY